MLFTQYILFSPLFLGGMLLSRQVLKFLKVALAAYARDPMPRLVAFVLFVPIELRRMKDAGIAYSWLIVYYFLLYLPVPPSGEDYISQQNLHAAVSDIPAYLFQALLLLKPGKSYLAHKAIFKKRERGSDKVTFSE